MLPDFYEATPDAQPHFVLVYHPSDESYSVDMPLTGGHRVARIFTGTFGECLDIIRDIIREG